MSAGKLRYTLVVRHPDTDAPTALLAGEEVPEWATKLVHADDLVGAEDEGPAYPEGDPSTEWTGKQLEAYAVDKGYDLAGASSKADKVAAIEAAASGNGSNES